MDRCTSMTCPDYQPQGTAKRCAHYQPVGTCTQPQRLVCLEWQKANQGRLAAGRRPDVPTDLFGNPVAPPKPRPARKAAAKAAVPPQSPEARQVLDLNDAPVVRNLTDEAISSFKALGVAICFDTAHVGQIWLVPKYSEDTDRQELSVEHAATLSALCATFPGSTVTAFEKLS